MSMETADPVEQPKARNPAGATATITPAAASGRRQDVNRKRSGRGPRSRPAESCS